MRGLNRRVVQTDCCYGYRTLFCRSIRHSPNRSVVGEVVDCRQVTDVSEQQNVSIFVLNVGMGKKISLLQGEKH
jgi:hypothetical protein